MTENPSSYPKKIHPEHASLRDKMDKLTEHILSVPSYPLPMFDGDIHAIQQYIKEEDKWYEKLLDILDSDSSPTTKTEE